MVERPRPEPNFEEFANALSQLQALGAAGIVNFGGYDFSIVHSFSERENQPGSYSPYVSILGEEDGVPEHTFVVTREDFYNFVKDFHSIDIKSAGGYKTRAGNAWTYNPTYEAHERGHFNWTVWSEERHTIMGVDPEKIIEFFAPYASPQDIPTEGLSLNLFPLAIWYGFSQHLVSKKGSQERPIE